MKKQLILFILVLLPLMANAAVEIDKIWYKLEPKTKQAYLVGDVNCDGPVNSADVQRVYSLMAKGATGATNPEADVNNDNHVNSADVQRIYSIMAGGN